MLAQGVHSKLPSPSVSAAGHYALVSLHEVLVQAVHGEPPPAPAPDVLVQAGHCEPALVLEGFVKAGQGLPAHVPDIFAAHQVFVQGSSEVLAGSKVLPAP